jgi:hypothetical protein
LASNGKKCPIIYLPDGEKVTVKSYQAVLCQQVKPWLSATYPEGNYVFQPGWHAYAYAISSQQFLASIMVAHC